MQRVKTFQVDDMGIEHSQYFQGYGVSFSSFTHCAYGVGDNPKEALDDCLDSIAQEGIDTEDLAARIIAENNGPFPETPSVSDEYGDTEDVYYHVGIKWAV